MKTDSPTPVVSQSISLGEGTTWIVNLRNDVLNIVDDQGCERHRSAGHLLTGSYLASSLASVPFASTPELDESMKRAAQRFLLD